MTYERPEIRFWSADELDAIQATMSGGGGGSSGGGGSGDGNLVGTYYQWDSAARISYPTSEFSNLLAGYVAAVITDLVTKNYELGVLAQNAVDALVGYIVGNSIRKTYYIVYEWYLWEIPNNPAYLGAVVGHFAATDAYLDEQRLNRIGGTVLAASFSADVPTSVRNSCPYYA